MKNSTNPPRLRPSLPHFHCHHFLRSTLSLALTTLVFSGGFSGLHAAEMPDALAKAKVIWQADEEIFLPVTEGASAREIIIPSLDFGGSGDIALRFQARYHSPQTSGLATSLLLRVNGTQLGPDNAMILNRSDLAMVSGEPIPWAKGWWGRLNGNWCVVLQYVPDFDTMESRVVGNEEQGHWFLINITSLVKSSEDIQLELENFLSSDKATTSSNLSSPDRGIVIENLSLVEIHSDLKP